MRKKDSKIKYFGSFLRPFTKKKTLSILETAIRKKERKKNETYNKIYSFWSRTFSNWK